MHAIVTGGAGFVGAGIVRLLLERGAHVTVIDDFSTGQAAAVPAGVRLVQHDITQPGLNRAVQAAVAGASVPTGVIHCAAQVSVAASVADPVRDAAVNIAGTVQLLEACRHAGVAAFVLASTAAVYGQPLTVPLTETSPTVPLSPYGCSKLAAETYVQALARQAGMGWAVCRPANIYGPGQRTGGDGAVVPGFIGRMLAGEAPVIHGDGEQTRDFVYIDDAVAAFVQALVVTLDKPATGATYHISSGEATSINDLWQLCAAATGWSGRPQYGPDRHGDIRHSVLDPSFTAQALGWSAQTSLADGIARTVAWWRG